MSKPIDAGSDGFIYPQHVIDGVKKSLQQAEQGELMPYVSIRDMLGDTTSRYNGSDSYRDSASIKTVFKR